MVVRNQLPLGNVAGAFALDAGDGANGLDSGRDRSGAWREREGIMSHRGRLSIALVVLAATTSACGTDDFSPGVGLNGGSGGSAQSAQATLVEGVISSCTEMCEARRVRQCTSELEQQTDASCAGVCEFLKGIESDCQQALFEAYQCQLALDPCVAGTCNGLLQTAESACEEYKRFL